MSERVSDLEVIKQFARMNTGIANMIACDLLDSRARVKEMEGALQEILAVPVTVTGDSDLLRQRHLVDGIAERALRGEKR